MKVVISLLLSMLLFSSFNLEAEERRVKVSERVVVEKLSEGVFIHISYSPADYSYPNMPANGLIYESGDGVYVIDTAWNCEQTVGLINWIEKKLKKTIKGFIITHWHVDCMGGIEEVHKRGIKTYALELTGQILKSKNLPVPTNLFKQSIKLGTGTRILNVSFPGRAHTIDNIVVWCPADKILYAGCLLKAVSWKNLGYTKDGDVKEWPGTLKKLLSTYKEAEVVIPGHGAYGGKDVITHTLGLCNKK